jgi:PelA/Pel-15E family pectate lyase
MKKIGRSFFSLVMLFTLIFIGCQKTSKSEDLTTVRKRTRWETLLNKEGKWYASDEAIKIAENVLLFQRNCGGWPKNENMTRIFSDEEIKALISNKKKEDATIDNGATFPQIRFLAKVYNATQKPVYREASLKGFDYLIKAQYPDGGWPQFYPLHEGYYTHITFNDDAMIGVMYLMRDVANNHIDFEWIDAERKAQAAMSIEKGLAIILKTQVVQNGKLSGWCAQYDENTLKPAEARSYELISISGKETVAIIEYLMTLENPSPKVIDAVKSACQWFENSKIEGFKIERKMLGEGKGWNSAMVPDSNAAPLWARFYDIETNQPMYIDRGGVKRQTYNELSDERRNGYAYVGDFATTLLNEEYPAWKQKMGITE